MQATNTAEMMDTPANPFVDFWNDVLAPKFIQYKHIMVDGLSRHSEQVFPQLPVKPGDKVLDVGCGFGDTAIALAAMVGETGSVTGIDCCDRFMQFGREQAMAQGVRNVCFEVGDAEVSLPKAQYDVVFARFGTQFFANPVAALRRMRESLKPGGKLVHIVWRELADNPWLSLAKQELLHYLPAPGKDGLSCGPGPFSMGDASHTRKLMLAAGYSQIEFVQIDAPVVVGRTIEEAIAFQLAIGPAGEVFREAGELAEARRSDIEAALARMLGQQARAADGIIMPSSSWMISACNP